MTNSADGYYAGYFAGAEGEGLGIISLNNGVLVGADVTGTKFDGTYQKDNITGDLVGNVTVAAPPLVKLIQGHDTGDKGITYNVPFRLPPDFTSKPYILLDTIYGPINVKLVKLRDL